MRKKKKSDIITNIILIFFVCLMLYPTIANHWNAYRNKLLATEYNETVNTVNTKVLDEAYEAAKAYNLKHTQNYIEDAFKENIEGYDATSEYGKLLNLRGDGVMGYIEIPKLNTKLTIYHGCGEDALSDGCGHVEGTSLPVGGESTHAVLSAHRGLAEAKLFTDLDKLSKGDKFYIHVLNKVLAYEVCDVYDMVDPNDTSELQIEDGRDYVTLLTCTPYAVNTHRLLVRGIRVPYLTDEAEETPTVIESVQNLNIQEIISIIGVILLLIVLLVFRRKEKKDEKNNEK